MCKQCQNHTFQWRTEPFTDLELAKFRRAKQITDPHKLNAMLPAYIKAHMRAVAAPKSYDFNAPIPTTFPVWCRPESLETRTARHQAWIFERFYRLNLKTKTATEYVTAYERTSGLKSQQSK